MHRLPLVTRAEWGAKKARAVVELKHPVQFVAISYDTSVRPCDYQAQCIRRVRRLQEKHMDMGLLDIHYNCGSQICMAVISLDHTTHLAPDFALDPDHPAVLCSFIIGGDGMIYEGRGWHFQPSKRKTTIIQPRKTHGRRIDLAFITDDNNPRARFRPPHLMVPPGVLCIHYGVNHGFIRTFYDIIEDRRPVKRKPNPDKQLDNSVL